MYFITDNNGLYTGLIVEELNGEQFYSEVPILEFFIKPKWNGTEWVEGATPEQIAEYRRLLVPDIITRRQFKIALAVLGKNENDILNGINQLPEPTRTIALISYTEAGTFERSNPELIFVGKTFLQMTDEQIDNVFTIGSQY